MPIINQQEGRRRLIGELLELHKIHNQTELVHLLRAEGYEATQSSVSRDLRDLGAAKLKDGYSLPERLNQDKQDSLVAVMEFMRDLRSAGPNLLVINTAIGAAQRVALVLDRISWPEIVGTVSGDDTIFVATAGAASQKRLVARLQDSASDSELQ
ncbi:MAG: arginine repressor [Rhodospirillaceae bacterium]|nr:arginine repressor [Rhodospirillaceae bacterium]|tara:strand:- start:1095 stop:1559 length:465 start_codon:yes stop_codon:yes gene_type:complete